MRKRGEQLSFVLSDAYERQVPEGHFLRKLSDSVDFSFVEDLCKHKYKVANGGPGRSPEPPVRLFKLLLLMFLYQVKFERELERRANDTISWRWFCGYTPGESVASHKTLWLFRKRLGPEIFDEIFARILSECMDANLVDNRRWHVDATKQDAAATKLSQWNVAVVLTRAMIERLSSMQGAEPGECGAPPREMDDEMKVLVARAASGAANLKKCDPRRVLARAQEVEYEPSEASEECEKEADERLSELEKMANELKDSLAPCKGDKDARIGHTSVKGSFCGYLTTAVVDEKRGIVLSYKTFAGNVDQAKTFVEPYEQAISRAGVPKELAADSAFDVLDIRQRVESDGVTGHIAMQRSRNRGNVFGSKMFDVQIEAGEYVVKCPSGEQMQKLAETSEGYIIFCGVGCQECCLRGKCTTSHDGVRKFKFKPELREFQEKIWQMSKTKEYKDAMKARMATIEPRFGHAKTYHNLGKCIYRSEVMTSIQTALSLMVLNLEKLLKYALIPQTA